MKRLTSRLAAIDGAILDKDQVVTLVGSLRKATLIRWKTRVKNLTLQLTQQSLIHKELKRPKQDHSTATANHLLQSLQTRTLTCSVSTASEDND